MPLRSRWILLATLGAVLTAQPVWAQDAVGAAAAAPSLAVTPAQAAAAASLLAVPENEAEALAAATFGLEAVQSSSKRQGTILMIVGGAAFVIGLIAEEEIVWIPGLAVGLFGLYKYLKAGGDI
jgi:hypothetical protein